MIFTIGFILSVIGMLIVIYKTFETHNILSPQMFVFAGLLLYLYIPAVANNFPYVNDDKYNMVLLFGVFGSFFAIKAVSFDVLSKKKECYVLKDKILKYIALVYIGILFFEIYEKIASMGSVVAVFLSNRLDTYLGDNLTAGKSAFRPLFFDGFRICFYIYIDFLFCTGNKKKAVLLFLVPLAHHLFTANTRFDFVAMAGAFLIYYLDRRMYIQKTINNAVRLIKKKLNFWKVIIGGFLGSYIALIFMRAANLIRHGLLLDDFSLSYSKLFLDTFSTDSNYYEFLYDLYNKFSWSNFEYGFAWILAPIINLIPRSLWVDKPYTSFSVRGTELVYYDYTSGNPVCTFTIFGEGYAQLGLLGAFLAPLVFLFARGITFKQLSTIKYHQLYSLVVLFSLLTYMRSESPIFWVLIDGIWIILIKKYLMNKK